MLFRSIDSVPESQKRNPFSTIDFLEQSNRIRRFNMMGTVLLRPFFEVRQPFFDHRVVDLVRKLPPQFRTKEKILLGRLLQIINEDLAKVLYERTGIPANSGFSRQIVEYAHRALKRFIGQFVPRLSEKPRVSIDYMYWLENDPKLQKYIQEILMDTRAMKRGHIDDSKMEVFLKELFSGKKQNLYLAMRLLSLELWYRFFIEHETPPVFPPET